MPDDDHCKRSFYIESIIKVSYYDDDIDVLVREMNELF